MEGMSRVKCSKQPAAALRWFPAEIAGARRALPRQRPRRSLRCVHARACKRRLYPCRSADSQACLRQWGEGGVAESFREISAGLFSYGVKAVHTTPIILVLFHHLTVYSSACCSDVGGYGGNR
ncbi:hypothetical protein MTO96_002450 [Rhipicephalus appendiculatus]